MIDALDTIFADSIEYLESARGSLLQPVAAGAQTMIDVLLDDGKILACGNGGSAADVLHFTGEMLNRFRRERPPLAAIALNSDVATLTAIGNDYSFDEVFSKQVKALGSASDLLFAITTSGNSANLLAAVDAAHERNMKVLVLSGRDGGELARRLDPQTDQEIRVAGDSTARIQEVQQVIIHGLCELIDNYFLGTP